MASSHNSIAFTSSTSSTWVIDLGAIGHVIDICSEFQSYTSTTNGRVRIANGSNNHIDGKGTVQVLPHLSSSYVLHVPSFSFNLLYVSAQSNILIIVFLFILLTVCFRI